MSPIALAFMAHPDDAEMLCAGTLIRLAQAGWKIHIATATPGDCGTTTATPWDISGTRTREAAAAAKTIGAAYWCLDERDGFVVYDKPTLRKAYDLFRLVGPSLVFTHAPRDYMVDHEQVSLLARSASFLFAAPNIAPFGVPAVAGSVPHLYYCDPVEGLDPLGNPVAPSSIVDISGVIDKKADMLACHVSQRQWLAAHHGVDDYIEAMKRHSARRGRAVGKAFGEGFIQHRGHPYPQDDLLAKLLTGQ